MTKIVNKLLSAGDKFMLRMYLRQPGFTYSACGPFTKNKEGIQKFKETKDTRKNYQNDLDMIWVELSFNMTWLIEILNIYLE